MVSHSFYWQVPTLHGLLHHWLTLCEGLNITFHVALALLKTSKEDLLQADFEGTLQFFRVQLSKVIQRYKAEENARSLMEQAYNIKVTTKKLKKHEKEYLKMQDSHLQQEDPMDRYKFVYLQITSPLAFILVIFISWEKEREKEKVAINYFQKWEKGKWQSTVLAVHSHILIYSMLFLHGILYPSRLQSNTMI